MWLHPGSLTSFFRRLEGAAAKGYRLRPFLTGESGVALVCYGAGQWHRDEDGHGGKSSAPSKVSSSSLRAAVHPLQGVSEYITWSFDLHSMW